MRKVFIIAVAICFALTGCSSVSQEEYSALVTENAQLSEQKENLNEYISSLNSTKDDLQNKLMSAESKIADLEIENSKLQQKASELDKLLASKEYQDFVSLGEEQRAAELARAEKERIEAEEEAERLENERIAREEAERIAKEQERLAEEAKGYETGITFNDISRSPDLYKGKKVKFTGSILQIMEGYLYNEGRMSTNGKYDDVVYIKYDPSSLEIRLLEDDMVTVYGVFNGLHSYTTILGATITLPIIQVDRIELIS